MEILLHPSFAKDFEKLDSTIRAKFFERKDLFITNPFHPLLNNHALSGEWAEHRSINVTGNFRAIFRPYGSLCVFVRIGTHPQLYG